MKVFKLMLVSVAIVLLGCGCFEKTLKYVPEDADIVVYLNTTKLYDSKAWELLEDNDVFKKEILNSIKDEIGIKKLEDSPFTAVFWGKMKGEDLDLGGGVISMKEKDAEDVYEKLAKSFKKQDMHVKKDEVDGCESFSVFASESDKTPQFSVVLVSDKELHFTFKDDPQIHEKEGCDLAKAIDSSAVIAIATTGHTIEKLSGQDDVGDVGIVKAEVFCSSKSIKAVIDADISDL